MEWIGYIAAILTTVSFLPQILHTIKVKETHSISLGMYSLFVTGTCFWLVYGILLDSIPMVLANVITVSLSSVVLLLKINNILTKKRKNT